jgi:hypothetical protein
MVGSFSRDSGSFAPPRSRFAKDISTSTSSEVTSFPLRHRQETRRITTATRLLQRVLPLLVSCFLFTTVILFWQLDSTPQQPLLPVDILDKTPPAVEVQGQLQVQVQASSTTTSEKKNKWDDTDLPQWMKDYFVWHAKQIAELTPSNFWVSHRRYLILRCYKEDKVCGGASDRLKVIPLILLAAHKSRRLLFIRWERPCALEEFLVPPVGGINWTAPFWLPDKVLESSLASGRLVSKASNLVQVASRRIQVVQTRMHDTLGGSIQYNAIEGEHQFGKVYHDLFRIFFEPSPAIASRLQEKLVAANGDAAGPMLIPGEYAVAHYRAQYGRDVEINPIVATYDYIRTSAINAVNCASMLQPGSSIYFASDSLVALRVVQKEARQYGRPIITIEHEATPLHLDKEINATALLLPSAYYSTFVDLYLMGNGRYVMIMLMILEE